MIQQLGLKRVVMIVALLAALGAGIFFSYFVFGPKVTETARKLSTVNNEISTLQTELDKMRADFTAFEKQKVDFDRITRLGFFNDQNRLIARERFDTMRTLSKVLSARYEIKAANIVPDTDALGETGFVLMETPISISISALDDLDVYRFVYYLTYGFPGHISIKMFTMKREGEVSPDVLKRIGTGTPPEIVKAQIDLEWKTLARKNAMETQNTSPVTNAITPVQAGQGRP